MDGVETTDTPTTDSPTSDTDTGAVADTGDTGLIDDDWQEAPTHPTWWSSEEYDQGGRALDLYDVDGDGVDEILVGAPSEFVYIQTTDIDAPHSSAYLLDGVPASGPIEDAATTTWLGSRNGDTFGYHVTGLGDVTGDGQHDVAIVGSNELLPGSANGGVTVFSASLGGTYEWTQAKAILIGEPGVTPVNVGGGPVIQCGDQTGDGREDLCVGATPGSAGATEAGPLIIAGPVADVVDAYSAAAVRLLAPNSEWASQQMGAADLNGDGVGDLLVSAASRESDDGGVYIVQSPSMGDLPLEQFPLWAGEAGSAGAAGIGLAGGRDLDGDGGADLFIGAPLLNGRQGRGYVVTSDDGGTLDQAQAKFDARHDQDALGETGALGDFDGDGADDLALGIPRDIYFGFDRPGRVAIFAGPLSAGTYTEDDAEVIWITSHQPDAFGFRLEAGDVDGDGRDDLVAGSPYDSAHTTSGGSVHLLSGGGL